MMIQYTYCTWTEHRKQKYDWCDDMESYSQTQQAMLQSPKFQLDVHMEFLMTMISIFFWKKNITFNKILKYARDWSSFILIDEKCIIVAYGIIRKREEEMTHSPLAQNIADRPNVQ